MTDTKISSQHLQIISDKLGISTRQVGKTVGLLSEGATVPFISRYRKEVTGSLDEVQVTEISREHKKLKDLESRKDTILKAIDEQGKLTDELRNRIGNCYDTVALEDIYLPYKRKRKTRAGVAKANGLEPLAQAIFLQKPGQVQAMAAKFITDQVPDTDAALQGARDIIAEWVSEDEKGRNKMRAVFRRGATIKSKVARGKEEEGAKYKDYFDYEEDLRKCPSHRILAIRRGEDEGFLRMRIAPDEEEALYQLEKVFVRGHGETTDQVKMAVADSYKRLLAPSIETEFRNQAKEKADAEAIHVFVQNLRQLLLAAPLGQKVVMGVDPGYRTGCKVVCLDASGNLLHHTAVYPHPPQSKSTEAEHTLRGLADRYGVEAIAVGNGTAGRETMALCKNIRFDRRVEVFMVNESGASIYSASEIAREEFPDHDVTVRGAVSIGRRLMDPLAELVKIDAKSNWCRPIPARCQPNAIEREP